MDDQSVQRFVPHHPLPQEIQEMKKDETVCKFCGVSYLIHNEMKALEERVKEAERQMEYYKGSVEREEKLKIKVASMEEESDKLSRALQASEDRARMLTAELTSMQDQNESLRQRKNDLDEKYQRAEEDLIRTKLKYKEFSKLIPTFLRALQTQKTKLKDIKSIVSNWNQDVLACNRRLLTAVEGSCKKFSLDTEIIEENLKKAVSERELEHKRLEQSDSLAEELKLQSSLLQSKVSDLDSELSEAKLHNNTLNDEISDFKEQIKAKSKELNDCKEKFDNAVEASKQEHERTKEALISKEKDIHRLVENCRNLEKRIAEFSEAKNKEEQRSANSLDEIKGLKDSLTRVRDEAAALKQEREMMIAAHHNRIEQLRESFKRKMEETEAWPEKLDKIVKEKEAQFNEEKNNMWKELTDSFQKEMDDKQQKHQEELDCWKKEAKRAQENFRKDLTELNLGHREVVKRLERSLVEAREKERQSKTASDSVIQNLEAEMADLKNRLRLPSAESADRVVELTARLDDSEEMLQQAEKQIRELGTKEDSLRQQVAFLQETVQRECEERLELTDALAEARTQLLSLQRTSGASFSRAGLKSSSPISSGSINRGLKGELGANELLSNPTSCTVGFDGGVGQRPGSASREISKLSRAGSVDDSRQRIAAALRRTGSKSRSGGNFNS